MSTTQGEIIPEGFRPQARRTWRGIVRFAKLQPMGMFGGIVLLLLVFTAVFADILAPFGVNQTVTYNDQTKPFSRIADEDAISEETKGKLLLLGGDDIGRDLLSRLILGSRVSLLVGLLAPTIGVTGGAILGILSAYFRGPFDAFVQRLVDALMSIPTLVLAMAIIIGLGFTVTWVIAAISAALIANSARVLRSHVMMLREQQYIEASRAIGASNFRIIIHHIVPNSMAPFLILFSVGVAFAIIVEAGLSYLGVGVQPPTATWGNMLNDAHRFVRQVPHAAIIPGLMISVAVFAINLFGDALRDVLDPKLRGAR